MSVTMKANLILLGLLAAALLILAEPAFAGTAQSLPWESPLEKIRNSLTGPVAMAVALIGVTVAGVALIFGSEFSDFVRRLLMLALVVSIIFAASTMLTTLFGTPGAVIP